MYIICKFIFLNNIGLCDIVPIYLMSIFKKINLTIFLLFIKIYFNWKKKHLTTCFSICDSLLSKRNQEALLIAEFHKQPQGNVWPHSSYFREWPCAQFLVVLQQSVGVSAAAVTKTGNDKSYSMTSLMSHHARTSLQCRPHQSAHACTKLRGEREPKENT